MITRLLILTAAIAAAAATFASSVIAAPAPVVKAGARGVVATRVNDRPATGFALRSGGLVVTAAGGGSTSVATAAGRFGQAGVLDDRAGLALVSVPKNLALVPLRPARRRNVTGGFVIGPPLGYASRKVRSVALTGSARGGSQRGRLPSGFLGAPVVNSRGELIGAVSKIGRSSWTLTPAAALTQLDAKADDGGGFPLWAILVAALVLLVAALGSVALISRRRRAAAMARTLPPQPGTGVQARQAEPLVRRREPAPEPEPEPEADDFEILLRDREP